jgi:Uma2 family endonuclease
MSFMYQEQLMTADEFLKWQAEQERAHELISGRPFPVPDRDPAFFRVLVNVTGAMKRQLGDRGLATFVRGEPLKVDRHNVLLPDARVAPCSAPMDPSVVMEMISAGVRALEVTGRTLTLRRIAALRELVVVDPAARTMRIDRLQADGTWAISEYRLGDIARLESLGIGVDVAQVFAGLDAARQALTLREFLDWDRAPAHSELSRYEFFDGAIHALAGATRNHERVVVNLVSCLQRHLADSPCEVFGSNLRLCCEATQGGFFPDVSVVCDNADLSDDDMMRRPMILIEVLSASTARHDRTVKRQHYLQIPSLREYVLVDHVRRHIDLHRREDDGTWSRHASIGDATLHLASLDLTIPAEVIYARVASSGQAAA